MFGEEENSYFRSVVKDAIMDLKSCGVAYVFFQEQVDVVKELMKKEIETTYDGTFYKLKLKKE